MQKKNPKLTDFFNTHCRKERYHLEIFKCGKESCNVCQSIRMPITLWNEISNRPQFIPLPIPKDKQNNEGDIKYEDYENVKYIETSEMHRPSYVFSEK